MPVPLDKQHVTEEFDGKKKTIPALHQDRIEDIKFLSYRPPPVNLSDQGLLEEWSDRIRFIQDDLHKLLQLPHDKFWCQAIFDETLHSLTDTYLRHAPRCHDVIFDLPEEMREHHDEVHRLIFMTCLRMATYKEDKEHFITPAVFGDILYENFIFDIPKLFDLCVLYGQGNSQLLFKVIENIFAQQPSYNDDLACVLPTMYQVFDNIKEKCGLKQTERTGSPQKLGNPNSSQQNFENLSSEELQDLVFYLADIGITVSSFLEVYTPACKVFLEGGFLTHLSQFYEIVPAMLNQVKSRDYESYSDKQLILQKLRQAKKFLMKTAHLIINHCFLQPLLENSGPADEHAEGFIQTLSGLLNERRFLADFESCHPFQDYVDILSQSACDIDTTRIQYIQDAFSSAFATYGKRRKPTGATSRGGRTSPDGSPGPVEEGAIGEPSTCIAQQDKQDYDALGACAPRKTGVELDSMIASVKDLLPDLGEGFIEICLEETGYDIESVINCVLEDKLPESLKDLDRNMPRQISTGEDPVISGRANVFDHDEFDVFSRDVVDTQRIFKGKRGKTDKISLDDKDLNELKPKLTEKYGVQIVEVQDDDVNAMTELYDDEYDDTYDVNNVGADDADSADELTQRRQFTVPRILGQKNERRDTSDESSEEYEEENPPKDEFIPNPALIRQRAEERSQWKAQRKAQNQRPNTANLPKDGEKKYDVKGRPKGHGQTDDVMKNRLWKEKHKSSRANHNRKYFSDKKRMGFGGPPK